MRLPLDLSTISEPRRPKSTSSEMRELQEHDGEAAVSALAWHELRHGRARIPPSLHRRAVECRFESVALASFPILDRDGASTDCHALERAQLEAAGNPPPFVNGQTAAIAHANDLILITSTIGRFQAFLGLQLRRCA